MNRRRGLRITAAAALGAGLLAAVPGAPPAHAAQDRCVPAGTEIAPAPWSQLLIAPSRAWPLSTGGGQRVAVVSTGVDEAPQLAGTVAARVDLAPEPEFDQPTGEPDCLGVGTGVAGIIAAQRSQGVGFHGVAPDAQILSAKLVDAQYPTGRQPADSVAPNLLASGIEWATDQDATVIVVPTLTYEDSSQLRTAVEQALADDIVVTAAVGEPNQSGENGEPEDPVATTAYPAAYDGVIGVGVIAEDTTAPVGPRPGIDLVAPGVEVVTTHPGEGLGPATGSAYAAAYVAGAAALVRAYRPDLPQAEVARRLFATATPAPEGIGSGTYGYGIVNAYQALLDRVVAGNPAELPQYEPAEISADERARDAAQIRGDALAVRLALAGLALVVVLVAAVGFGVKGRRRRWRTGFAAATPDPPRDHAAPPADLFADRQS